MTAKTKPCVPVGEIDDDPSDLAQNVKLRMYHSSTGREGVMVWVQHGYLFVTNADSPTSQDVKAFALIGVYTKRAKAFDIAEDIVEWRKAA